MLRRKDMSSTKKRKIWVAVRVQRGFISEVDAYTDEATARRRERYWRRQMNPDYDETTVSKVVINARSHRTRTH
jgi:hypothetical protein